MSARPNTCLGDVDHITLANLEQHDQRLRVCPDWTTEHLAGEGIVGLTNDMHPAFDASKFVGDGFNLEYTIGRVGHDQKVAVAQLCV